MRKSEWINPLLEQQPETRNALTTEKNCSNCKGETVASRLIVRRSKFQQRSDGLCPTRIIIELCIFMQSDN
jgi:hypothetical protein